MRRGNHAEKEEIITSSAIPGGEIATLGHEAWDDAMERGSSESEGFPLLSHTFLARAECSEVLSGPGDDVVVEGESDTPSLTASLDISAKNNKR